MAASRSRFRRSPIPTRCSVVPVLAISRLPERSGEETSFRVHTRCPFLLSRVRQLPSRLSTPLQVLRVPRRVLCRLAHLLLVGLVLLSVPRVPRRVALVQFSSGLVIPPRPISTLTRRSRLLNLSSRLLLSISLLVLFRTALGRVPPPVVSLVLFVLSRVPVSLSRVRVLVSRRLVLVNRWLVLVPPLPHLVWVLVSLVSVLLTSLVCWVAYRVLSTVPISVVALLIVVRHVLEQPLHRLVPPIPRQYVAQQPAARSFLGRNMTLLSRLLLVASSLPLAEKRRGLRMAFIIANRPWSIHLALLGRASIAFGLIGLLQFTIRIMYLLGVLGTWFDSSIRWLTPLVALVLGLVGSRRRCIIVALSRFRYRVLMLRHPIGRIVLMLLMVVTVVTLLLERFSADSICRLNMPRRMQHPRLVTCTSGVKSTRLASTTMFSVMTLNSEITWSRPLPTLCRTPP